MLPGFRFLFTAIVLSMSILIFGLGAAALLRAAHEEFANLPARRAPPQPMFARQNDDQPPTLALLRVDTPDIVQPTENAPAAAVPEGAIDIPAPAEPENLAALKPAEEPVQVEAAKPETPAKEASAETVSGACGRNRSARRQCGSEAHRHRGNAGTCRGHSACNFAGAGSGYPVVRRQYRHDPDRDARRSCRHRRREESGREAGPQCPQAAGRTACPGTAADDSCAASAAGSGGSVDASGSSSPTRFAPLLPVARDER